MSQDTHNIFTPDNLKRFLSTFTADNIRPGVKPQYQDTPPVWKQQLILGLETQNDIRRFTQIRCWIKPPSERFATANTFLSLVNSKGSVFVRLNSIDELKALVSALQVWIPEIEAKLEELAPLEAQFAMAKAAFDVAFHQNGENEDIPYQEDK